MFKKAFIILFFVFCILFSVFYLLSSVVSAEEVMQEQAIEYLKEGIQAQKSGDIDRAISLYFKAAFTDPNYAKAHNNLGTAYAQKGERAKAEEEYNKAVTIDPNYSVALKNIAIIYLERKDYEKFSEYWKRASGLDIYSPFIIDDEIK